MVSVLQAPAPDPRALAYHNARIEKFSRFLNQVTSLVGSKGRGKSLSAVAISHNMHHLFGMPIVVVGSRMDLRAGYIPHTYIDEREFVDSLGKVTTVARETPDGVLRGAIETVLRSMGVNLFNALLIFDESYKLFDARTPSDKLVRVFGYFVAQSRHYGSSILLLTPYLEMIDKRVRKQIDWFGRCSTTCVTRGGKCVRVGCSHMTTVRFTGGLERWKLKVYGPNYWHMYDSWTVVGFRRKHLEITTF